MLDYQKQVNVIYAEEFAEYDLKLISVKQNIINLYTKFKQNDPEEFSKFVSYMNENKGCLMCNLRGNNKQQLVELYTLINELNK